MDAEPCDVSDRDLTQTWAGDLALPPAGCGQVSELSCASASSLAKDAAPSRFVMKVKSNKAADSV